ncbi:hypothetical protein DERF_009071 [Dermatophagoides farinae]|uniref:Uncharacterized protein n=1 Tax=Dermatophagoides farinae TaxID=6954 RepID=A0A922L0C8_DERFA|nr:hypothetical protein DERF_009071 [Dermatophagoides farinae]
MITEEEIPYDDEMLNFSFSDDFTIIMGGGSGGVLVFFCVNYSIFKFIHLVGLIVFAAMFAMMTATSFGARLLSEYPEFFTASAFSKKGPSRTQIESTRFRITIIGRGWSKRVMEQQQNKDDIDVEPEPDETIMVQVSGKDPGYMATSTCLVQSGLTILMESDKIPKGVLTPPSAFRNTQLLKRLRNIDNKKNGNKFAPKLVWKIFDIMMKN